MDTSLFRIVSFGYAAENKKLDSKELDVLPVEFNPFLDGEVLPNATKIGHSGEDAEGRKYTVEIEVANSITATWLQWGSNRVTAPDVRRGEKIILFQFGDHDEYFWVSAGMTDHLRRLETATFAFSGTRDESVKVLTPDNSYFFEVSTHTKHVTFSTSKADGEPFAYTMQFDTAAGVFTVQDDDGNSVQLNSPERSITAVNKDNSFISIDKRNIFMEAGDKISAITKFIYMKCDTIEINANLLQGNIGHSVFTGTMNVQKAVTMDMTLNVALLATVGGISACPGAPGGPTMAVSSSGVTITKAAELTAGAAITGALTNNGINVGSTHTHITGAPGAPTSTPS